MKNHSFLLRGPAKNLRQVAVLGAVVFAGLGTALHLDAAAGPPQHYQQTNLVSDEAGLAKATDPQLVNPWGLARSGTSPWWVADNGTGVSTIYNGAGAIQALVVTVPTAPGGPNPSAPTGIVSNGSTTDFLLCLKHAEYAGAVHLRHRGGHHLRLELRDQRGAKGQQSRKRLLQRRHPGHASPTISTQRISFRARSMSLIGPSHRLHSTLARFGIPRSRRLLAVQRRKRGGLF